MRIDIKVKTMTFKFTCTQSCFIITQNIFDVFSTRRFWMGSICESINVCTKYSFYVSHFLESQGKLLKNVKSAKKSYFIKVRDFFTFVCTLKVSVNK